MQRIIEALSNLTRSWFLTLWSGPWWHERLATALAHAYDVEIHAPNKKNFQFGLWASYKPTPSLTKISYKYNSMLT